MIKQNIQKAQKITNTLSNTYDVPDSVDILTNQLNSLSDLNYVYVLCTCPFYIVDYNPHFIEDKNL